MTVVDKDYRKHCTLCDTLRHVLVRCQVDETGTWNFVCPGICWNKVSGGCVDGDGRDGHRFYRYGGMWKNKHEAVSAKKPKRNALVSTPEQPAGPQPHLRDWTEASAKYTRNDRVQWGGLVWICRKSHASETGKPPDKAHNLWKSEGAIEE